MYDKRKNVREIKFENVGVIEKEYIEWSVNNVTILLSGFEFNKIRKDKHKLQLLLSILTNKKCSFIAYSLIPSMKLQITNLCKEKDNKLLAIGDGYNDIGMIRNSNIGVCVKNANNQNVRVNSDYYCG